MLLPATTVSPATLDEVAPPEAGRRRRIAVSARRKLALGVVCVYATSLIVSTHWPKLRLPNLPVFFSIDKVCHFSGYAVLTFLLLLLPIGLLRKPEGGLRAPAWLWSAVALLLVAFCSLLDEITQPLVQRDMDRVDWACDVGGSLFAIGVVGAGLIALSIARWFRVVAFDR